MNDSRAVNSAFGEDDLGEVFVRPQQLEDFVGQPALRRNLRVFVDAARGRAEREMQLLDTPGQAVLQGKACRGQAAFGLANRR